MNRARSSKAHSKDKDEREQFRRELIEGYRVRREEDAEIDKEWEYATLEKWDEFVDGSGAETEGGLCEDSAR